MVSTTVLSRIHAEFRRAEFSAAFTRVERERFGEIARQAEMALNQRIAKNPDSAAILTAKIVRRARKRRVLCPDATPATKRELQPVG